MTSSFSINQEKIKHLLYLISISILLCLSVLILAQATFNITGMNFLIKVMNRRALSIWTICGAILLVCFFLVIGKFLHVLSKRSQIFLTLLLTAVGVTIQYLLLFYLQAILRYDHLRVFDGALEMIQTGKLSLTANDSYFGRYPFNISITAFNSIILRI
ncbi:MAG: hypothetical protein J6B94_13025 [Lachnospiraceae bacterium]|nr:hypothetical protein [Lachnospiraceae bacterium]